MIRKEIKLTEHIQINSIPPRIRYIANGTNTSFDFPFAIFKSEDLKVYFGSTLQSSDTYTVTIDTQNNCGSVSFQTAPASGTVITLNRELAIARTSDFQEGASLRADVLNDELDYQIACQQQIADNLNRSMVLPPYAVDNNVDLILPTPSAGKAIVWNASGTNLENSTVSINALESTLNGYKTSAETAATTATTKASVATDAATTATTQAGIATAKAAEATSALSNKVNKDMDDVSAAGKTAIVAFGMPDYSAGISISTTPNTVYTATKDGYFVFACIYSNADVYCSAQILDANDNVVAAFGNDVRYKQYYESLASISCPVPKGYKIKIIGSSNATLCAFYPMKGV